jgi:two-component system LytT family response regulator
MKPIRIVLIDDEAAIRTICKSYLQDIENAIIVGEADKVEDAEIIINACNPDLILLDIQLGKKSGFDLLTRFSNPTFKVIFITAYEKYALSAIKAGALDYLLKPISEQEFINAIQKAMQEVNSNHHWEIAQKAYTEKQIERITLSANDGYHVVWVKDIMYCSSSGNYTTFHLQNGKQIIISKIIKEYEAILPSSFFVRTHQSYLVNMNYVERFTKEQNLILKNQAEIIVSNRKKEEVMNWFKNTI